MRNILFSAETSGTLRLKVTPSTHYFEYYDIDTILSGELGTALRCGVWKPFIFSVTKFLEEASDGMKLFRKFSL